MHSKGDGNWLETGRDSASCGFLESVKPDQQKVFLLHTKYRPECKNGVWHSTADTGALFLRTLLPAKTHTEIIGGKGKEFWTNNQNFPVSDYVLCMAPHHNWMGQFRMEISPETNVNQTRFLHVLQAADADTPAMISCKALSSAARDGAELSLADGRKAVVWVTRTGKPEVEVTVTGTAKPVVKPAKPALPPGAVLIPNGNFEQGIDGWNLYGTDRQYPAAERKRALTEEAEDVHSGHGAMRAADNLKDYRTYVVRPVEVPAGKYKTMTVKAWIKGVKGKSFRQGMMFHKRKNGRWKNMYNSVNTLVFTNDWKEYSATFNVPADADGVFALVGAASFDMADTGEILVDNVTFQGELK